MRPGMTVCAPGLALESPLLLQALRAVPDAGVGVRLLGVWCPASTASIMPDFIPSCGPARSS